MPRTRRPTPARFPNSLTYREIPESDADYAAPSQAAAPAASRRRVGLRRPRLECTNLLAVVARQLSPAELAAFGHYLAAHDISAADFSAATAAGEDFRTVPFGHLRHYRLWLLVRGYPDLLAPWLRTPTAAAPLVADVLPAPAPAAPAAVAYQQASLPQQAGAVRHLRQVLAEHFPYLPTEAFQRVLAEADPPLQLLGDDQVEVDYDDLTQLVQYLASAAEHPVLDPPVYGSVAEYLARQLVFFARQATQALAELQALPPAVTPHLREIIGRLAPGNALAEQVVAAHAWLPASEAGTDATARRAALTAQVDRGEPALFALAF